MTSQTTFRAAILDPTAPVPDGLTNGQGAGAGKRFDVYRNNVVVGLIDALIAAFPVLHKLVGDPFFKAMGGIYVRNHPPTSPLMMHYGAEMPSFLKGFAPVAHLPYLPDVARLEIALRASYHAADSTALDATRLAALSPDALFMARFTFAPSTRLLSSRHPLYGIWAANSLADAGPPGTGPQDVLITRAFFDPKPHLVSRPAAVFTASLMAGNPFGAATAAAGPDLDLPGTLALLLSHRAITDIN